MSHRTTTGMNSLNHQEHEMELTERSPTDYSGSSHETNRQDLTGTLTPYTRGSFLDSIFSLAYSGDQPHRTSRRLTEPSQPDDDVEFDDLENVQGAVIGFLALDPTVESNGLPFVLQGCATWLSYCAFQPLSVAQMARNDIVRAYVMGEKPRQILHLFVNNVNEFTRSAEYDPAKSTCFLATEAIFRQRLAETGTRIESTRGLTQQQANEAMSFVNQASPRLNTYPIDLSSPKWILLKCTVDSLSSVLGFMQLAAPTFRRACPGSLDGLVNLPTLLATTNSISQQYIMIDALLGMLTVRPMFFRYTVRFTPQAPESLFSRPDGPSLRCSFGVPVRLVMTFAHMNRLVEDYGSYVPKHMTDELEQEIKCMKPIVGVSTERSLMIGRMVAQQAWFQAALIYLYMGLCGCDSTDGRVVTVRSQFIKLLASTTPRRNIDSFLVFPLVMLGVATESQEERNMIRRRMLGVYECARPGRMGNDFVRILDNLWAKRGPVVWSDLRKACWEVVGENVRYDRGSGACEGQKEGGDKDAVFVLESGATIQNVTIGANQAEGIHCKGPCNIYNVWFEDVHEDAITIKQTSGTSNISGGGAKGADDKVIQHNGGGTVNTDSYCVQDFGKLYHLMHAQITGDKMWIYVT